MTEATAALWAFESADDIASRWLHDKAIVDDWIEDYSGRTGKTREEIVTERRSRWQHDGRESIICKIGGYGLYGIELEDGWRYTVVTPWGMSEGLVDAPCRDDSTAMKLLADVIAGAS